MPGAPSACAVTQPLFRSSCQLMLAGLSFLLGCRLCNARVHGRFSLAQGPSLPSLASGTAGGGAGVAVAEVCLNV